MKLANGQEFTIIAELRDRTRKYIGFTYQRKELKPLVNTGRWTDELDNRMRDLIDSPEEGIRLFDAIEIPAAELANLPVLTYAKATELIEHAFYSGAKLEVLVQAYLQKGDAGMLNYAEAQSAFAMPSSPAAHLIGTPEFEMIGAEDVRMPTQAAALAANEAGEWDNPALIAVGPLHSDSDMRIAQIRAHYN